MALKVTLELPADREERLRRDVTDLEAEVRETFLVELFRRGEISDPIRLRWLRCGVERASRLLQA